MGRASPSWPVAGIGRTAMDLLFSERLEAADMAPRKGGSLRRLVARGSTRPASKLTRRTRGPAPPGETRRARDPLRITRPSSFRFIAQSASEILVADHFALGVEPMNPGAGGSSRLRICSG